jgi:phosphohistidine phosphatase
MQQHDRERALTQRGVREAMLVGNYLLKEQVRLDAIITSTAVRARTTAELITDAMKIEPGIIRDEDALYEASTRTFFEFIQRLDDNLHHILCVGHNPAISYLTESLTKSEIGDMPPAGLAVVKFSASSWKEINQGSGELQNYIFPQMLGLE